MKFKKFTALLLAALLVLSLAACGTKDNDKKADMSSNDSAMTDEPKNAEEALALHKKLLEQENAILSENTELWEKVFMEADKGMAMIEDGKNYGDFLLKTIEDAKEEFSDEEYEWLKESATEISNIENKLTALEETYPEIVDDAMNGNMQSSSITDLLPPGYKISETQLKELLRKRKDTYRRYRDLSIFAFIGVYLLSVIDAYVDAELSNFDITPDLSMKVEPAVIDNRINNSSNRSVGLQCSFRF